MPPKFRNTPKSNPAPNSLAAQTQVKFQQALALHQEGRLAQAQTLYEEILKVQPRHFDALQSLGVIAIQTRNYQTAVSLIGKAIKIQPNNAAFYYNYGIALQELKQLDAALTSYNKVISINPNYAEAYFNRGNALSELKRPDAAVESFNKAIAIRPDYANAYNNRGNALKELKQLDAAVESFNRAIAIKPDHADAYNNRGTALKELKQLDAALESFNKAITIKPGYAYLYGTLLYTRMQICDWQELGPCVSKLFERIERKERATTAFPVLALTTSLSVQRKVAEIWINDRHPPDHSLGVIAKRPKSGKIRIGYFSADFRNHPVSFLAAGLFEAHDRRKFEIHAFSYGQNIIDPMRLRLEMAFDSFIDVRTKSDADIAKLSREMKIDIAIDLSGLTADGRTGIFARRAAPIQINYLGYPGTMGAPYIDYIVADKHVIPQESEFFYMENVAHLPCFQVNDSKRGISKRTFTRRELGLPEAGFVFCCFNNSYKITPGMFDAWMRILNQVEGSVLWLTESNPTATNNLRREAIRRNVAAERLVFAQRIPLPEYLASYRAADLFLDTLLYNAGTTASDALWAGLPVLTLMGEAFASRMAGSLLHAIGLPELITHAQEDYEALAIELASNPRKLQAIKTKLEKNRLTMPLFDTQLFTRHIEDAYNQMYERYQAGLPPGHIHVVS